MPTSSTGRESQGPRRGERGKMGEDEVEEETAVGQVYPGRYLLALSLPRPRVSRVYARAFAEGECGFNEGR